MDVFLLTRDLVCTSELTAAASRRGVAVQAAPELDRLVAMAAGVERYLAVVDLTTPHLDIRDAVQRLRAASPAPTAIVAFAPHVQAGRLRNAATAGCDRVLTRGQFTRDIDSWLANHLHGPSRIGAVPRGSETSPPLPAARRETP